MEQIKNFFSNTKNAIIAILTGIVAIFGFIFYWKSKQHEDVNMAIDAAGTQKKLDLIQADIAARKEVVAEQKGQIKELNTLQTKLEEKRKELDKQSLSDKQITDHWNQ